MGLYRSWRIIGLFLGFLWEFWWLNMRGRWRGKAWKDAQRPLIYRNQGRRFRETATDLGGLLIKLGQFFSSRVDVLPEEYTEELAQLQDAVPPVDFALIRPLIEEELGMPLEEAFRAFDQTSLAAASLGQVHRAVLPDGATVAVKVLRPGIEGIMEIDLKAFRKVLTIFDRVTDIGRNLDLEALYREFSATLREELDYGKEGRNAETFRANFSAQSEVYIPAVHWSHSGRRVLVLEFVEGVKINDYENLEARGIDRHQVAVRLVNSFIKQIVEDGFFHADPHPGNLFVGKDGTLIYIDFGMVGRLSPSLKNDIKELIIAVVSANPRQIAQTLKDIGFLRPHADSRAIEKQIAFMTDYYTGANRLIDPKEIMHLALETRELVANGAFQLPAELMNLGRAIGALLGLCMGLDPQIDLAKVAKPAILKLMKKSSLKELAQDLLQKGKDNALAALQLPATLLNAFSQIERGNLTVQVSGGDLNQVLRRQETSLRLLAVSVVFTGLLLSSTLLLINDNVLLARTSMAFSVLAGISWIRLLFKKPRD